MVNYIFETEPIDTVMHFAAQTHVDNSFGNSLAFTHTNMYGTHVLLEAAKKYKDRIRRFIHVSTDEVYGQSTTANDDVAFDEESLLAPTNPYAATKAAAEFMVKAYRPRQYPEKLIPRCITLLAQNRPVDLHGDGTNRRSFLHVDDVAEAFDIVLHSGVVGNIYNIGTEHEIANIDVARIIMGVMGLSDRERHIDVQKLTDLGWTTKVKFNDGIRSTVAWYLKNQRD
jgi:UDP-glucose 4,6-dehydratase